MTRFCTFFLSGVLAIGIWSCLPDSPNTPEEVVRSYQSYIDQNMFDQAGSLSTPAEQKRLNELNHMISLGNPDSSIMHTKFLALDCAVKGDSAVCRCRLQDEYETYEADYYLIKQREQWRVDVPQEGELEYEEEMLEQLKVVDSLLNELNQAQ